MFDFDPDGPDDADADLFDADDGDAAVLGCVECGYGMSALADHCPHCGAWQPPDRRRPRGGVWTVAVLLAVVLVILALTLL